MVYYEEGKIILRTMVREDIDKLVRGFEEQNWHKPYELFEEYYNLQESEERAVIVAEEDGAVAGYVTLLPYAKEGPFADRRIPEVVDFNVLIKYQRKGIGTRIMDVVEQLAKVKSGYISLSVGLHYGYGSAQRMYIKRGYIPDGTGVWYQGRQLEQYVPCNNDDNLTLYLLKAL
ncbi:MAG: GCN5-related N-acetyltransferase [Herbinix sp.]|jgi:GNAT superfamily N-acetyltransferase|nr:GCN5-related N-acetyltransferase [Herbinix sp.]